MSARRANVVAVPLRPSSPRFSLRGTVVEVSSSNTARLAPSTMIQCYGAPSANDTDSTDTHQIPMNDAIIPQVFEQLIALDQANLLNELERLWKEDPSLLKRIAAYVIEHRAGVVA